MTHRLLLAITILTMVSLVSASELELVTNGGFEPPLDFGWETLDAGSNVTIGLELLADPDFDYELRLTKGAGTGYGRAVQEVSFPSLTTDVTVSLDCDVTASGGAWAAGGLMLNYLDESGMILGQTVLSQRTADCPWVGSDTYHMIDIAVGGWRNHTLSFPTELDNLPGVPRDAIRKLGVVLFVEASDC